MKTRTKAENPAGTAQSGAGTAAAMADNRREPRYPASGEVTVELNGLMLCGSLLDVSVSGFRMEHEGYPLESGQQVRFKHPTASGTARVIWNRSSGGMTQTGFYVGG